MKKRGKTLLFSKRADVTVELLFVLIQLILALSIYIALQNYVNSVEDDTLYEKFYLSKDLALFLNTLYASPGEVNYEYSNEKLDISRFIFDFKTQKVVVKEVTKPIVEGISNKPIPIEHPYGEDKNLEWKSEDISQSDKMVFVKTDKKLEIKNG